MKNKLPVFLQKYLLPLATPKALPWLALPVGIMAGIVLPGAEADLKNLSGGLGPLDLQLYYTPATAWQYLEAFGPAGRSLYLFCELTADIAYPVFYTLFFLSLTLWLLKKSPAPLPHWAWAVPCLPLFFDLLENAMLATLLLAYPQQWLLPACLAGVFTAGKWASLAVLGGMVLFLGITIKWRESKLVDRKEVD